MSTQPGFSSRSTSVTFHQFPQRDGAAVTEADGVEPGFSNSEPDKNAPEDIYPDVAAQPEFVPGSSNGDEVDETPPPEPVEHAIVAESTDTPTKTTARKSTGS